MTGRSSIPDAKAGPTTPCGSVRAHANSCLGASSLQQAGSAMPALLHGNLQSTGREVSNSELHRVLCSPGPTTDHLQQDSIFLAGQVHCTTRYPKCQEHLWCISTLTDLRPFSERGNPGRGLSLCPMASVQRAGMVPHTPHTLTPSHLAFCCLKPEKSLGPKAAQPCPPPPFLSDSFQRFSGEFICQQAGRTLKSNLGALPSGSLCSH